jgi:hypothetical protein
VGSRDVQIDRKLLRRQLFGDEESFVGKRGGVTGGRGGVTEKGRPAENPGGTFIIGHT